MSILLEALKKSERQRQLGQTPTLDTPSPGQPSPVGSASRWIPISLVTLSAFAIAWFGWQQFREPASGASPGTAAEVVQNGEQAAASVEAEAPMQAARDEEGNIPPGLVRGQRNGKNREEVNRSFSQYQAEKQGKAPGTPGNVPERKPDAARRQAADRTPQAIDENPAEEIDQSPAESPVRPEARQTGPEPDAPESGGSRVQPHIAEPISFWALPQGVRDTLPEIKITVLVFAESPADRFLLANGQRLVEKDELQSGIVLDEIRRDGAVFLYRNYRFLVKG